MRTCCILQRSFAILWMTPNRENVLGWSDVVTDWKVELRRDQNMIAAQASIRSNPHPCDPKS
jgi:hypothetical protein